MLAKEPAARPAAAEVAFVLGGAGRTGEAGQSNPGGKRVSRRWLVGSGAAASLGVVGLYAWSRLATGRSEMRVLFEDGEIEEPVFSPDGSRVAFSWKPAGAEAFKLAIVGTGGGSPRVLTSGRVSDIDPAWSPDGNRLCFVRQGLGENALYVTALQSGVERRITSLYNSTSTNRVDWLRDSRTVVFSENWFSLPISLIDVEKQERRALPKPPEGSSDTSPKCSPDGNWIAFIRRFNHTNSDLFVVAVSGGEARRLTFDGAAKNEHGWTPDGSGILFKARLRNRWRFWHVPLAGGSVKEVALPQFAIGSFDTRVGRNGGMDVVSADHYQVGSISRMEIPEEGQNPSRPVRMIASEEHGVNFETNPAISPDGLRLAFVSTRTGCPEIWVSDSEGQGPRQMTSFGGPEVTQPAWSPDGRYLLSASAPDGGRNLFLVELESGSMRWLTSGGREETEPQWSRDGRWITFASSRSGQQELWRMPAGGGAARRLTHNGGAVHRESPDGRWIYFVRHEHPGLWRMPWDGGNEELVLGRVSSELYRAWAIGRRGVYYTYKDPGAPRWTVLFYDPEHRTERAVAVIERPLPRWSGAMAISPDERWMLLPIIEARGSRLVLFSHVEV
jgi:Tol biopolymer transport system component